MLTRSIVKSTKMAIVRRLSADYCIAQGLCENYSTTVVNRAKRFY